MADNREREVKLGAWVGFAVPELGGVCEGVSARPMPEQRLDATYYDTPDLRLARWGVSVRYRTGDGGGWTVKLPDGDDGPALVRRELSFDGGPGRMPAAANDMVAAYARTEPLVPAARLRTLRHGVELRDGEDQRVAEVVDDEVSVLEGRRVAARFREVEVEVLADAEPALLHAVVARLRAAGAGEPERMPKVVRALGGRALAAPELVAVKLDHDATAADAVRAAMVGSVLRILRHDAGVRIGDDPEDVHQARVGTRRLRSDLRTFRALLDADWLAGLRDELRWLGALLGDVRDTDVLLARLQAQADALPDRDAAGVAALVRRLVGQREAARARLLDEMRRPRYAALLERLVADAGAPRVLPEAGEPAVAVFPELVRRPWRHLAKAVDSLDAEPPDESLHEVRILAKRCRYAAEAAAPVIGKQARALASAVADEQTVLGDHQDAVVAEAWLREAAAGVSAPEALVAGELVAVQRSLADSCRRAFPGVWKHADRKRLRAWLA